MPIEEDRVDRFGSMPDDGEFLLVRPQCLSCRHFQLRMQNCTAFPRGIPDAIYTNKHNHRLPYPNDNGIRFEEKPE